MTRSASRVGWALLVALSWGGGCAGEDLEEPLSLEDCLVGRWRVGSCGSWLEFRADRTGDMVQSELECDGCTSVDPFSWTVEGDELVQRCGAQDGLCAQVEQSCYFGEPIIRPNRYTTAVRSSVDCAGDQLFLGDDVFSRRAD